MKFKLMSLLTSCLLLSSIICGYSQALPKPFSILPQPQKVEVQKGQFLQPEKLDHLSQQGDFNLPVLGPGLSKFPVSSIPGKGAVNLILDKGFNAVNSDEGYQLTITKERVNIVAKTEAGLFYGCQSLEQLLEDAITYKKPLPACVITDQPALAYRAVHFDVKHHLDHMNYYYQSIDRLARYKINAVVFEYEDKLRYQRQPLVGAPQSISIDEMAALTNYARKRNIEITPLVQGLGHATFILKHEQYASLRELPWSDWAFCPLHEGTYQVLFDLYRDAIKATPGSKYLHIGGDEIGNIGICPRCKPTADKEGIMSLNLYWLKRVCEFAKANDRIPIFWDDMPLQHAGLYRTTWNDEVTEAEAAEAWKKGVSVLDSLQTDFPKNCIYMRWNYGMARQPGNIRALDWYQKNNLTSMIATATNAEGGMLFQEDERNKGLANAGIISIRSFIQLAASKNITGMLCTAWDDKSPHMENYWRGFIAAAEYSWSPDGRSLEEFDAIWAEKEFGHPIGNYTDLNNRLRKGSVFFYEALFRTGNLFDDDNMLQSTKQVEHWLKPLEGREKLAFDYTSKLIDLPDLAAPGSWSKQYAEKLARSAVEVQQYEGLQKELQRIEQTATKNKYYWRLAAATYRFQTSTPAILLALQQVDQSAASSRNASFAGVQKALDEYHQSWAALQEVYSETRFISNPVNFVQDRYFHLASQREDLSWMIQPQELYEGMIKSWMNKK